MIKMSTTSCFLLFISQLLLLSSLPGTCSQGTSGRSPVTFKRIGTVIFSGQHYIIPLQVNVSSLLELCKPLELLLTQTKSDYNDLLAMFKTKKGNRELNTNVSAVFPSSMR